jgi:hypothetical protein
MSAMQFTPIQIDLTEPETADRTEAVPEAADYDRALVMQTCANCGARMIERKCKLICTCGYFLSCSDYY